MGFWSRSGRTPGIARQARFANLAEIKTLAPVLRDYIQEAVEAARAGLEVDLDETDATPIPEEFQARLDANPSPARRVRGFDPGRQRAYLLYFNGAKQSKTRASRVEKCVPQILDRVGDERLVGSPEVDL